MLSYPYCLSQKWNVRLNPHAQLPVLPLRARQPTGLFWAVHRHKRHLSRRAGHPPPPPTPHPEHRQRCSLQQALLRWPCTQECRHLQEQEQRITVTCPAWSTQVERVCVGMTLSLALSCGTEGRKPAPAGWNAACSSPAGLAPLTKGSLLLCDPPFSQGLNVPPGQSCCLLAQGRHFTFSEPFSVTPKESEPHGSIFSPQERHWMVETAKTKRGMCH